MAIYVSKKTAIYAEVRGIIPEDIPSEINALGNVPPKNICVK